MPATPVDIDPRLLSVVRFFEEQIPFNKHLGMRVVALAERMAVVMVPMRDDHIGDPSRPAIHGGVTATLIDAAGGAACFSTFTDARSRVSTVDLRIDYLRPGPAAPLVCKATVVRMGNRVATVRMVVYSNAIPEPGTPEHDAPIALGQGVYNIVRDKP